MKKVYRKKCAQHGYCDHTIRSDNGKFSCKKCAVEKVTEKRRRNKKILIEYLGGCCVVCGYSKCVRALEFHHKDPKQKDFGLAQSGVTKSINKLKVEVKKCVLLCNRCHAEVHSGLLDTRKIIKKQKYNEDVFEFLKNYNNYIRYVNLGKNITAKEFLKKYN